MTVIQEEPTGCGIASVANLVGLPYVDVKARANQIGIFAEDENLFSDTRYVRTLLKEFGVHVAENEVPFSTWESLPDLALLSIKYREEDGRTLWHWVVFKRTRKCPVVLDSAAYLERNERTDFGSMSPKWFIEVVKT
jgi:hypothetical protein